MQMGDREDDGTTTLHSLPYCDQRPVNTFPAPFEESADYKEQGPVVGFRFRAGDNADLRQFPEDPGGAFIAPVTHWGHVLVHKVLLACEAVEVMNEDV